MQYKFYPILDKYESFFLEKGIHKVYYEVAGNPNGIPIVYVHGGPGAINNEMAKRFFNPKKYRIIVINQRGCGKSQPFICLEDNTTDFLIEDMEDIRKKLSIEKWIIFGGSWGTTLSLAYAIKYPRNIIKMILRGIFLGRSEDINWLYQAGASYFQVEAHEKFKNILNKEEQKDIVKSYYKYFTNSDTEKIKTYAKLWSDWESSCVSIKPRKLNNKITNSDISMAILEAHYFVNKCFFDSDNYILENTDKIKNINISIVHGRYDIDCRASGAYQLHQKLNNSKLYIVEEAGHSSLEEGIRSKLIELLEE